MGRETLSWVFTFSFRSRRLASSCKHLASSSWSGDIPTIPPYLCAALLPVVEKALDLSFHRPLCSSEQTFTRFIYGISHVYCNLGRIGFAPLLCPGENRADRYSLNFCENRTLLLGVLGVTLFVEAEHQQCPQEVLLNPGLGIWRTVFNISSVDQWKFESPVSSAWLHHTGLLCWRYACRCQGAALVAQTFPQHIQERNIRKVALDPQFSC